MALPHGPLTTTPDFLDKNADKLDLHRAMVRYCDEMLAKLIKGLEDNGIRDNTIIVWTTDNGTSGGITGRLNGRDVKGGKTVTTENGTNMPFIVNCPGIVPEGVKTDALTDFTDILPTFAELGGAKVPADKVVDGKSFAKLILGKADDGPRTWIMSMGGQAGTRDTNGWVVPVHDYRDRVLRDKQYKIFIGLNRKTEAVYDLQVDPGETKNLIDSKNKKVLAARKALEAVAKTFPKLDNAPKYTPTPPRSWDLVIKNPKPARKS
jgi:arylsulfatase A-like enzyme